MEYSIEDWVENGSVDRAEFRKAVHIILHAISSSAYLKPKMVMKGGMLLGIRYQSSRYTEDIDFSTAEKLSEIDKEEFEEELNEALQVASDELPYGVKCKVQSCKIQPKIDATFPSFNLKIGYANTNNANAIKRLEAGNSTNTVKIDYSFNEMTYQTDDIKLEDESITAYGITDLIAEKLRSIIQQPYRRRNRRQDVYDLHFLLTNLETLSSEEKLHILNTLYKKCEERVPLEDIHKNTLEREDIKEMSRNEYDLLVDEVAGDLPDFENAYNEVKELYNSLPWDCLVRGEEGC